MKLADTQDGNICLLLGKMSLRGVDLPQAQLVSRAMALYKQHIEILCT